VKSTVSIPPVSSAVASDSDRKRHVVAWILCPIFYSMEYASRSSPSVMVPELGKAFGTTAVGVAALLGTYYYTYSITSLIAGASLDWAGAKWAMPIGLLLFAAGCLLFLVPSLGAGYGGRLLQGAGSAFAFTGAVYLASHGLPARWLSTAIGTTQCLGMAGGFAGTFALGPMLQRGLSWQTLWLFLGIGGLLIGVLLFAVTPSVRTQTAKEGVLQAFLSPYRIVFRNPQSYLCGVISGLLFVPTTIGAMTWGVAFFQKDRGLSFSNAVTTASLVTMGWVVGCPVLGWLADRLGRRKPVLLLGMIVMLAMMLQMIALPTLLPIALSCFLFGIGSGAAMIPYTIIKEINPDGVKGSATGAMNFITFGISAIIWPALWQACRPGVSQSHKSAPALQGKPLVLDRRYRARISARAPAPRNWKSTCSDIEFACASLFVVAHFVKIRRAS
jgi:MFS family permease